MSTQTRARRRWLILDLGGVVCRFSAARRLAALAAGSGLSAQEVHQRLFASGFDEECDRGRYDLDGQCQGIRARLGVAWDQQRLAALWAQAFEPDGDVLGVVDRVRPTAGTALLTNNGPLVHAVVRDLLPDVAARFDQLCFSYQAGATKPDARAFLSTLERLGLAPEQCVFVDDSERNVAGARAVGIDAFPFVSAPALDAALAARGFFRHTPARPGRPKGATPVNPDPSAPFAATRPVRATENGAAPNRSLLARVGGWLATSHWSLLSARSILSIGSVLSILSVNSAGSILSIGSAGSILSIGSAGSILSIGSAGSVGSIGGRGARFNPRPGRSRR